MRFSDSAITNAGRARPPPGARTGGRSSVSLSLLHSNETLHGVIKSSQILQRRMQEGRLNRSLRPESGRDWLTCADFARMQEGRPPLLGQGRAGEDKIIQLDFVVALCRNVCALPHAEEHILPKPPTKNTYFLHSCLRAERCTGGGGVGGREPKHLCVIAL